MLNTWNRSGDLVEKINQLWKQSEELRKQLVAKRDDAAKELDKLLGSMLISAKDIYGDSKYRIEPIVEQDKIVGLKVWVNDNCNIFRTKESTDYLSVPLVKEPPTTVLHNA